MAKATGKVDPKKASKKADLLSSGKNKKSSAKKGKKKWSKTKTKERVNNAAFFDQATFNKLTNDIPKLSVVTTAVVSDKLKVNGSLARAAIRYLKQEGLVKLQGDHHQTMAVYTGTKKRAPGAAAEVEKGKGGQAKGQQVKGEKQAKAPQQSKEPKGGKKEEAKGGKKEEAGAAPVAGDESSKTQASK